MISVEPATLDHARAIHLRAADAREIAALGVDKVAAVADGLRRALWADTYFVDGEVAAIVGVSCEMMLGDPTVWMLTGTPVDRCRKDFLRITRTRVREMLARHATLTCNVHAEYAGAIRWLRWLGFRIEAARPSGPRGALFHTATMWQGLRIGPSSIADLEAAPNIRPLLAEYAAESAIECLPPPSARVETYRHLESVGALQVIGATNSGDLVGYITVLVTDLPHYGVPVAVAESFFVARAHRKTGAGLKLLKAAENNARERGARGLLVTAPFEGDLFKVLPRVGYAETNRVFFKRTLSGREPGNVEVAHA